LEEKRKDLAKTFTANEKLITIMEANVIVILSHLNKASESYSEGVDYIENMLRKQLIAAIGKEVTPVDFTNYLTFHNRKIFHENFRPRAFSYAIRRPDHYPEGVLSIEAQLDDGVLSSPITTIVAQSNATHPMHFPLNAAAKVSFYGERYLHGYVSHQFEGYSGTELSLYARARQFSSFILLVGRIVSADLFDPKYATIIQNKDEFKIPLLLETLPTPKEFKDAIQSLSPEQQRFCKAFRSMQLESTLFGVCIIQIKPQLEKLLKLPDDSLTKEIQLSQDLLNLFIKYQIPSDLISYDGPAEQTVDFKTGLVKEYVSRMHTMITASKNTALAEAQAQQQMRLAQEQDILSHKVHSQSRSRFMMKRSSPPSSPRRNAMESDFSAGAGMMAPPSDATSLPTTEPIPREPQKHEAGEVQKGKEGEIESEVVDYTKIPTQLERKFEEFDESNALRPTIINPGNTWNKTFYKSLLSEAEKKTVNTEEQGKEKNQAFDLLDALTKSGALSVDNASLHVIIASTHCFDKSIINTVVQDNINPIEKVENSSLIVASTIHQTSPLALIAPEHVDRISTTSASLIGASKNLIDL
jgi:hypothetical protein